MSVILASGGLDSAVLIGKEINEGHHAVRPFWVDYGQRNRDQERWALREISAHYRLSVIETKISVLRGSNLTGAGALDTDAVVVPCRNAILLSLAVNYAVTIGDDRVLMGCTQSDAQMFPDCRFQFFEAYNVMLKRAELACAVAAPFMMLTKSNVVQKGRELGVPMDLSWSCYEGAKEPCLRCIACQERKKVEGEA